MGFSQPREDLEFLQRMKVDQRFRTYYYGLYDSLRLLYRRVYNETPATVIQAEKNWSSKLDHVLDKERGALEWCEAEIIARRSRVTWLERVKADDLQDRNFWRSSLVPLPVPRLNFNIGHEDDQHQGRLSSLGVHPQDEASRSSLG